MFQAIVIPTVTCTQPKGAGFARASIEVVSSLGLAYIKYEAEVNAKQRAHAAVRQRYALHSRNEKLNRSKLRSVGRGQ